MSWFGVPPSQYAELDRLAYAAYLQGLHDAGWRVDPRQVPLGCMALIALRFGFIMLRRPEPMALTEGGQQRIERLMGRPLAEVVQNMAAVRQIVVSCADEARTLIDAL